MTNPTTTKQGVKFVTNPPTIKKVLWISTWQTDFFLQISIDKQTERLNQDCWVPSIDFCLMLTRGDSYFDGGHLPPLLTVDGWETCSDPGIILDGGISAHLGFQKKSLGTRMRCLGSRMRCLGFQKRCLGVFGFWQEVWALSRAWGFVRSRTVR